MKPGKHHNVQIPIIEAIEIYPRWKLGIHAFMIIQSIADNGHGLIYLVNRRIIGDSDVGVPSKIGPFADILQTEY